LDISLRVLLLEHRLGLRHGHHDERVLSEVAAAAAAPTGETAGHGHQAAETAAPRAAAAASDETLERLDGRAFADGLAGDGSVALGLPVGLVQLIVVKVVVARVVVLAVVRVVLDVAQALLNVVGDILLVALVLLAALAALVLAALAALVLAALAALVLAALAALVLAALAALVLLIGVERLSSHLRQVTVIHFFFFLGDVSDVFRSFLRTF